MASSNHHLLLLLYLLFLFLTSLPPSQQKLTDDYYDKTCPEFRQIVREIVTQKQLEFPTTAAGTLRLFFHDCMVEGCDASLLIVSNAYNVAERDADLHKSLPGDAYDVVTRAKTALELQCPGTVSCSDILAEAARDLVKMVGGPHYPLRLGRKDGFTSNSFAVEGHLGRPNMTITQLISLFSAKGFSIQEMVTLVGAHTIGFSHCSEFSNRIFNFSKKSTVDPTMNPKYAEGLRKLCANYSKDAGISAYNDVITPGKFDNMYYINLQRRLGLLASDQAMALDPRTKPYVDLYAANQTAFFEAFARTMQKVSNHKVKTGKNGEVRHRCDTFNNLKINKN